MDANGLQTILTATPAQTRVLEGKLEAGFRYPFGLQLGREFRPAEAPAFVARTAPGFELYVETPLAYRGADEELHRFAHRGRHGEPTLEALFTFIRRKFRSSNDARSPAESVPDVRREPREDGVRLDAARITDLDEAHRRLDRRQAASRTLLDRRQLQSALQTRIHGQDRVLAILAERVCVELAKSACRQPLSFFLFGPSGVGKTETAVALADALSSEAIGVPHRLVRHNMNEYQERHSAYRFVGAPPSYVGYGDEPLLIRELRASPRLVVVFDEIEKAHPDIVKTLMALVDTGTLSCPAAGGGATDADFRRCILVFTSNISGPEIDRLAQRWPDMASLEFQLAARDLLVQRNMPPEVVGRIRTLLLFRALDASDLLAIFADKIQACGQAFGLTVQRISPVLLAEFAARAASTQFGVRIAEQLVEQTLAAEFVRYLAAQPISESVEVSAAEGTAVVMPMAGGSATP